MPHSHITAALLGAVSRGEVAPRMLVEVATAHLKTLCPVCRAEIAAFERRKEPADYAGAVARAQERLAPAAEQVEAERRSAGELVARLLALSPAERRHEVERASAEWPRRAVAERLLAEARAALPARVAASHELASLAEALLVGPEAAGLAELRAYALALQGNALRAQGNLLAAGRDLSVARRLLAEAEPADPSVAAQLDKIEGTLCRYQRRFGEAEALLTRAAALHRRLGETTEAAQALLALGITYAVQGLPAKAAEAVYQSLELLDPRKTPQLYLRARFELAHFLEAAGDYQAALDFLTFDADLYETLADKALLRCVRWLEAKIAFGLGEEEEAEAGFLAVREALGGNPFDQAQVGLDLAVLYLKQGRHAEVRQVAAEAVALFAAQAVHREALAALTLFEQAARREAASADLASRLRLYLAQAQADPAHRFEPPG